MKRFGVRAAAGRLSIGGLGLLRVTDVALNIAAQEISARSGCDMTHWFRGVDMLEISGNFTVQDIGPELEALISGGTQASTGYEVVDRKSFTVTADTITLDDTPILDAGGKMAGVIYAAAANGEQVLNQAAADGAPSAGAFSYQSIDDTVDFNSGDSLTTVKVTYAYSLAGAPMVSVESDDEPPLLGLLMPLCGYDLLSQGTKKAAGIYLPRVRITGRDYTGPAGGGEIAGHTINFVAMENSSGLIYRMLFPKDA